MYDFKILTESPPGFFPGFVSTEGPGGPFPSPGGMAPSLFPHMPPGIGLLPCIISLGPWVLPSVLPPGTYRTCTWRPVSNASGWRFGEALNPGPEVAVSTLNVASLCMHQDEVLSTTLRPTLRVFTETCLTQQILPTIQRKARQANRFVVPGCICAPRSSAHKSDSQSRGESGGVLVCSDLPTRQGNAPMDQTAWLSTRAVEAIASLSSELCIRVVGLYGFSKRYPGHIERTNQLLTRVAKYVAESTLPCVFVGDFNCDLSELSAWKLLQDKGWVDSALLQQARDGKEPQPTWKSYSRIDFVLLPPALVPFFQAYQNFPDTVSDHSEVQVNLEVPETRIHRHVWKPCRDMRSFVESEGWQETDFAEIDWRRFHEQVCNKEVDAAYDTFCKNFEDMVAEARNRLGLDIPLQQFQVGPPPKLSQGLFTHHWSSHPDMENSISKWTTRPRCLDNVSGRRVG